MALELIGVSHRFGRTDALRSVSLALEPGEIAGFLGHNGAGKTTAMRVAMGLLTPDAGRVQVDGLDAARHPREARERLGALIDVPAFHAAYSGERNLTTLARLAGLDRREALRRSGELLELVGLQDVAQRAVRGYSHGMRQRLGIAQALLGRPRYALLDEPMNGLDPDAQAELREALMRLARVDRVGLLVSSHQLREMAALCDRVIVLRRGSVVLSSDLATLLAQPGGRLRVRAAPLERAERVLADMRCDVRRVSGGVLSVGSDGHTPRELARALVRAEVELDELAPESDALERVYLATAREVSVAPESAERLQAPAREPVSRGRAPGPDERRSAGAAELRAARYALEHLCRSPGWLAALALPMLLALVAIALRGGAAASDRAAIADQTLYSATAVTGFDALAAGLQAGVPLLALVAAALGSQRIASDRSRGTLVFAAQRPLARLDLCLGQWAGAAAAVCIAFVALAAGSLALAGLLFDFGDVVEILPNGQPYPMVSADELWPRARETLLLLPLPLLGALSLGFAIGAGLRSATGALALSLVALLALDLARAVPGAEAAESLWLSTYLPSPLLDRSALRAFSEASRGLAGAEFAQRGTAWLVPIGWTFGLAAMGAAVFRKRSIP